MAINPPIAADISFPVPIHLYTIQYNTIKDKINKKRQIESKRENNNEIIGISFTT